MTEYPVREQILYQADPHIIQALKSIREHVPRVGMQYVNQLVRVQTIDGHVIEGTILNADAKHLYLSVPQSALMQRSFFNPFYGGYPYHSAVLPLVLFDLLAITLVST